mmetsp:Transcript_41251/g.127388  ORF Transcript_41251/g.127388 Transcript_41251/m.127388 type:complete len:263 (-) Transcript_41251:65-853(-)
MLVVFLAFLAFVLWKIFTSVNGGGGSKGDASDFRSDKPYVRKYECSGDIEALPTETEARGNQQGMPACKFLLTAKKHLARDYVLIIDRSGSMSGRNWSQAEQCVKQLAPYICRFDPDGVDLFFFDHDFVKIGNVKSAQEVGSLFDTYRPRGSTDLARVLHAAFSDHFAGSRGATTILVVTDGAPNSKPDVERVIKRAAASIERDAELSVSFIQVGNDSSATRFLQRLDDDLSDAKFDIVDTVTTAQCKNMSFNELIANSIYD